MAKRLPPVPDNGWSLNWGVEVSGKRASPQQAIHSAPTLDMGMPVRFFLRDFWQKKALLMRQAIPDFSAPLSANDLAGIACQPHSLARLVSGSGKRFKLEYGPFEETRFSQLAKRNWTLLVQQVDQWDESVAAVLDYFNFLPRWRIEDVMVSYAVRGGSVGAHVDQYDVFLLQARGKRRWQIDTRAPAIDPANQSFVAGAKLKLLKEFNAEFDWVLEPGDILYIPPGVPHHGIAVDDDCMTFSIGLRAPSVGEMLIDLGQQDFFRETQRYRDGDLHNAGGRELAPSSIAQVRTALANVLALPDSDLGSWFASFMSGYRSVELPALKPIRPIQRERLNQRLANGEALNISPGVRVIGFSEGVHMGGRFLPCGEQLKAWLSHATRLDHEKFWSLPEQERDLLGQLLTVRALRFVPVLR